MRAQTNDNHRASKNRGERRGMAAGISSAISDACAANFGSACI
jgi:hypothetical protein